VTRFIHYPGSAVYPGAQAYPQGARSETADLDQVIVTAKVFFAASVVRKVAMGPVS
jgi:hypothetical protein